MAQDEIEQALALKIETIMAGLTTGLHLRARIAREAYDQMRAQNFTANESLMFTRDLLDKHDADSYAQTKKKGQ